MSAESSPTSRAVFLSDAPQDAEVARRICDTLRAAGVEVWFDADGGLEHGDEWDQKTPRLISKECVLFIPLLSAIRRALERTGSIIGPHDLQIAAIALYHGLTLVTHNTREFSRLPELPLDDWEI